MPTIAQEHKDEINGLNLFAYCCNDPVNNVDYDGKAKVLSLDNHVKISDFTKKNNLDESAFNCFAYALGKYNRHAKLSSKYKKEDILKNISKFTDWVKQYLKDNHYGYLDVTGTGRNKGVNYKTSGHKWLIAFRIGKNDFHFMKRSNTTHVWSFKAGTDGKVYNLVGGYSPNTTSWNIYVVGTRRIKSSGYYNSTIKYFVIWKK